VRILGFQKIDWIDYTKDRPKLCGFQFTTFRCGIFWIRQARMRSSKPSGVITTRSWSRLPIRAVQIGIVTDPSLPDREPEAFRGKYEILIMETL
jgi:hypothetical protein